MLTNFNKLLRKIALNIKIEIQKIYASVDPIFIS